jgi:glutaredoxin
MLIAGRVAGHLFLRWAIVKPCFIPHLSVCRISSLTQREVKSCKPRPLRSAFSGCLSCVRVKEFLTQLEIPFKSVNVLSDNEGRAELRRLGARSIPIVSKGEEFVYAQSIEDVARFVGRMDAVTDRLPPPIPRKPDVQHQNSDRLSIVGVAAS